MRIRLNLRRAGLWPVWLTPGVHEKRIGKNPEYSYPEPALVPLGEKPKV